MKTERFRIQVRPVLDVLERPQRDIEEIARSAGGVEHTEPGKALDKGFVDRLGLGQRPRPLASSGPRSSLSFVALGAFSTSAVILASASAHSASSGSMMTGRTIIMIFSRSV
jgi:hypothetical protein